MAKKSMTQGIKKSFPYAAYLSYYPKRFEVSKKLETDRHITWGFKDGYNSKQVAKVLAKALDKKSAPKKKKRNDWWLCVIPASSKNKTRIRFKPFCEMFCEKTGFQNGYSLIKNAGDRTAIHTAEDRNRMDILDNIKIKKKIAGKKILLFDDVYTTGRSFFNVATKLKKLGASEVRGLFLAKTAWKEEVY